MNLKTAEQDDSSLSKRGQGLMAGSDFVDKLKRILDNPYDPVSNPEGIVNLGTAENVSNSS